jgi:hypothetical protein
LTSYRIYNKYISAGSYPVPSLTMKFPSLTAPKDPTMKKLSLLMTLLLSTAACNEAQFAGTSSRATSQRTKIAPKVSCSVNPSSVKVNGVVTIEIDASRNGGDLVQTVKVGEKSETTSLKYSNTKYSREDGEENTVKASVAGKYSVSLSYASNAKKEIAACSFDASKDATPAKKKPTPPCKDDEISIGADIAFLIDNSNSNAATDCQNPEKIGTYKHVGLYKCGSETNREKAVKSAYDFMKSVSDKEASNELAKSRVSIASFPSSDNYMGDWTQESKGWISVEGDNKSEVSSSMLFTREPFGLTPYGSAVEAAKELFSGDSGEKAKVAVLVTDGEPTDEDPESVAEQAKKLRAQGVDVITVLVNSGVARQERAVKHTEMMAKINQGNIDNGNGNWFTNAYNDFNGYMSSLIGGADKKPLADRIADGQVVEVADSKGLEEVFLKIIETKAIKCKKQ